MKKCILVLLAGLILFGCVAGIGAAKRESEEQKAMDGILRLHIRAADDSAREQALKYAVRNDILSFVGTLTEECETKEDATLVLEAHLDEIQAAAQEAVIAEGSDKDVTVRLDREEFEYREYDGFFLPAGEYDSLIVEIGEGQGKNWWCVVFPAACYAGAGETVETNAEKMPVCFRLANRRNTDIKVECWIVRQIRKWFGK